MLDIEDVDVDAVDLALILPICLPNRPKTSPATYEVANMSPGLSRACSSR